MGSSSNPILNGHLLYPRPTDTDRSLNEDAADKIRDYRADYNNRPSNSIVVMPAVVTTSGRLHCALVRINFRQLLLTHSQQTSLTRHTRLCVRNQFPQLCVDVLPLVLFVWDVACIRQPVHR